MNSYECYGCNVIKNFKDGSEEYQGHEGIFCLDCDKDMYFCDRCKKAKHKYADDYVEVSPYDDVKICHNCYEEKLLLRRG